MKIRYLTAAIPVIGLCTGPLAAHSTHARVHDHGVAPSHVEPSSVGMSGDQRATSQIVVMDMGTALLGCHQVMRFRRVQRVMASTALGETGFGLPGAIGASFATGWGEVLWLNCDGGMMRTLQGL